MVINGYSFLCDEKDVLELDDGCVTATVSAIDSCHLGGQSCPLKTTDVHLYVSMWERSMTVIIKNRTKFCIDAISKLPEIQERSKFQMDRVGIICTIIFLYV